MWNTRATTTRCWRCIQRATNQRTFTQTSATRNTSNHKQAKHEPNQHSQQQPKLSFIDRIKNKLLQQVSPSSVERQPSSPPKPTADQHVHNEEADEYDEMLDEDDEEIYNARTQRPVLPLPDLIRTRRDAQIKRFNSPVIQSAFKSPALQLLYTPTSADYVQIRPAPALEDEDPTFLWDFDQPENTRALGISIIGTANAGKSSLVNRLIGTKLSAVSPKRNTTRTSVLGVVTHEQFNTQLVIYDTPGIIAANDARQYERTLSADAWRATTATDVCIILVDAAKKIGPLEEALLKRAMQFAEKHDQIRLVLALNKVDLVHPKTKLLETAEQLVELCPAIRDVFYLSVTDQTGDSGIEELEQYLIDSAVPDREWDWSADTESDLTQMQRIAEVIREKVFQRVHKEVPYMIQQTNTGFTQIDARTVRIDQQIRVDTEAHKSIIIGNGGSTLQWIQRHAADDIAQILKVERVLLYISVQKGTKGDESLVQGIRAEADADDY
jgi:GTP-binding protein Era